jgi:hypothetical protein
MSTTTMLLFGQLVLLVFVCNQLSGIRELLTDIKQGTDQLTDIEMNTSTIAVNTASLAPSEDRF